MWNKTVPLTSSVYLALIWLIHLLRSKTLPLRSKILRWHYKTRWNSGIGCILQLNRLNTHILLVKGKLSMSKNTCHCWSTKCYCPLLLLTLTWLSCDNISINKMQESINLDIWYMCLVKANGNQVWVYCHILSLPLWVDIIRKLDCWVFQTTWKIQSKLCSHGRSFLTQGPDQNVEVCFVFFR